MNMKTYIAMILSGAFFWACNNGTKNEEVNPFAPNKIVVEETMDAGGYTYLLVTENGAKRWFAVNQMEAAKGDVLYYEGGMTMTDFKSETLGRTFEEIVFVDKVTKEPGSHKAREKTPVGGEETIMQQHGKRLKASKMAINVEPAEGGITVAGLYADKAVHKGKKVKIRGQVTKFNESIMDRNWIHIQDGTEHDGKFDLTFTSKEKVDVGDVVVMEGIVALDKDFGHGYFYEILVEEAEMK
jgi:hypothetical protein